MGHTAFSPKTTLSYIAKIKVAGGVVPLALAMAFVSIVSLPSVALAWDDNPELLLTIPEGNQEQTTDDILSEPSGESKGEELATEAPIAEGPVENSVASTGGADDVSAPADGLAAVEGSADDNEIVVIENAAAAVDVPVVTENTAAGNSLNPAETDNPTTMEHIEEQPLVAQDEAPAPVKSGRWVVDARSGSLERYWVYADGTVAKNQLVGPSDGADYYAWAMEDGHILRGKWDNGKGRVYVADNDGRLIGNMVGETDGWVVTDRFDGGLQRYWVDATTRAAKSGFFTIPDYGDVFGLGGSGLIMRGDMSFGGRLWSADNDGRLRSGWYITDGFGQGAQRYWFGDTVYGSPHAAAVSRLIDKVADGASFYAYAMADGHILRGKWDSGRGRVYAADNDGRLIGNMVGDSDGWVVTDVFDGGLQRYWVDAKTRAAASGFFTVPGYGDVFGLGGEGYMFRGAMPFRDFVVLADNDGRLPSADGWLVSDAYGQGTQRYWIEKVYYAYRGAKPGYSASGYAHYTLPEGYVVRGTYVVSQYYGLSALRDGKNYHDDTVVVANNDGKVLTREEFGALLVDAARSQLNAPYDHEGSAYHPDKNSRNWGFNCSGFTWWVYSTLGICLSHNQGYYSYYTASSNKEDSQMWGVEKRGAWKTAIADLHPGDLVFFATTGSKWNTGHVGVYIGDGKMLDCNTTGPAPGGVQVRSVARATFVGGGLPITLIGS